MHAIGSLARFALRLVVLWIVDGLALLATAALLPGIAFVPNSTMSLIATILVTSLLLDLVNLVIRPVLLLLAVPFGSLIVLVVGLLANAITLRITSALMPVLQVSDWLSAFAGGLVLALVNTVLITILNITDDDSFYQNVVERLARRDMFPSASSADGGLIMLEIDGLSYWHIQEALQRGYLPTLHAMLQEGYVVSRVDCGLPSQTSACQAGILFGRNHDIPAFRWFDKDQQQAIVSSKDAGLINARYATGHGLLRNGSSINNMMDGDAEKSLLTLACVKGGDAGEKKRRARDIYLLMLNPYFLMRTLVLFFADAVLELWQGWRQEVNKVEPRMNRRHRFYPLVRAATTVLMRDVPAYLVNLDIIRGTPALYCTYPGYDEVAHHSGPRSSDAFRALRQFDRVVARVRKTIATKAPRPYELVILSDHGQSTGWTFKQRYGYDLKGFIEQHLPQGARVGQSLGGDDGDIGMYAISAELENVQQQEVGSSAGRAVMRQWQRLLRRGIRSRENEGPGVTTPVTVMGSGNLAMVYFDLFPRKITLNELDAAFPGMVEALVEHEGVGFVVGYDDACQPVVLGKGGQHHLHTGKIVGSDPLLPYVDLKTASVELRAEQVQRVADFPHAGDLIINSSVYPDGSVACMEELIGNHGGLGGEQTDAFILHPAHWAVPPTKNSADVFDVLNAHRYQPATPHDPTDFTKDGETLAKGHTE